MPSQLPALADVQDNPFPANMSFIESLRQYFETYGDPTDFHRTQMISLRDREWVLDARRRSCRRRRSRCS